MTIALSEREISTITKNVLVLDDEPRILASIKDLLEEDFVVFTSNTAEAALAVLGEHEVAVILSDQRMPGMSGDAFLAEARQLCEATRILITGYADLSALVRAVNHGQIYGYVAKPWDPVELRFTVQKASDHFLLVKALRESEARFRTVFDGAPIGMSLFDESGRILKTNKALQRMLGYQEDEFQGRHFDQFVHPSDKERSRLLVEELFARTTPLKAQKRYLKKDGSPIWAETTATLLQDRVTYGLKMLENITEQKEAEEARLRLARVLESTSDFVVILDAEGAPLYVNQAAKNLMGVGDEGKPDGGALRRCVSEGLWERIENEGLPAATSHGTWTGEGSFSSPDGSEIPASVLILTERRDDGSLDFWSVVGRDISHIRSLEAQMRQAQKMEAIGRLAGGVAHDFNNLLTAISGYAQLVRTALAEDDEKREDVLEIEKAAQRAARLTSQLLAFSRKQVLQTKVTDLNAIVSDMDKMLRRLIGEHIRLATLTGARDGRVEVDRGQIEQVIVNLVVNARDAMPKGGEITIETSEMELDEENARRLPGAVAGRYVTFSVGDTGQGMDAKTQTQIFEPFFTTKPLGEGTGLGLATVYGIVKQSRGFIYLTSKAGHGTTFRIYLPAVSEKLTRKDPQQSAGNAGGGETILLVEDEPAVRRLASRVLRQRGYTVLEAESGDQALKVAANENGTIHLVVTDVVLRDSAGPELARKLTSSRPETRVLFMSGYSDRNVEELTASGATASFLLKPFEPATLAERVRQVLDGLDE